MATGIEYVITRAALDRWFRRRLLRNRPAALARLGDRLSDADRAALTAITDEQLVAMIDGAEPRLPGRRSLLAKALACLGIVSVTATVSCVPVATGSQPDDPSGESEPLVTGSRPDAPG
ncbi:MAG: hypothetical protein GF320_20110 [Armatimonadia bacterium]|nr:hypothetical protein [Armatimonadia bacterium]